MKKLLLKSIMAATLCANLFLSAGSAGATVWFVNTTADTNDGETVVTVSLREAIAASMPGDYIAFSSQFNTPRVIRLRRGPLVIDHDLTILGPGANLLAVSGNYSARNVFDIAPTDPLIPHTIELRSISIVGAAGAGILHRWGVLDVTDCVVALNLGSGIVSGQISTLLLYDGDLNVTSSTITRNIGYAGGGIVNFGSMYLANSTISGNIGVSATWNIGIAIIPLGGGGGIFNWDYAYITGCTITNNRVIGVGAGGVLGRFDYPYVSNSYTYVSSSICAGNVDNATVPDVLGDNIHSAGFNLIGNVGTITGFSLVTDQSGSAASPLDPMLDPLSNNGHGTLTHRLQVGSPAIDQGNSFGAAYDQRYLPRTVQDLAIPDAVGGDGADIGAYEVQ